MVLQLKCLEGLIGAGTAKSIGAEFFDDLWLKTKMEQ